MGTASSKEEYFYEACGYGAVPKVKYLLNEGVDVNFISSSGGSCPIHVAAQGKLEVVQILIKASCDVNVKDKVDKLPIHHAAIKNHTDIIEALIAAGSKIDVFDKNHWTPIIAAAYFGCLGAVETLLKHKCDVQLSNKDDRTALHEVCRSKSNIEDLPKIVSLLIDAGCPLDSKCADTGMADFTPLMFACYHGHLEIVSVLVKAGCDLNIQDSNGWTALHWSADRGQAEVAQYLVDNGVDINIRNKRGEEAVDRTKRVAIKRILQPDVEHPDITPTTPTDNRTHPSLLETSSEEDCSSELQAKRTESEDLTNEKGDGNTLTSDSMNTSKTLTEDL